MAHDVLRGAGYRTVLLGGEIPDRALAGALKRHRPAIVALSSTMTFPDSLAERASLIGEVLPSAQVIAGGAATERLPGNVAVRHVARLDELLAAVDAMLGPRRA
jgi:methanogenic corrinoid protein MtbC1